MDIQTVVNNKWVQMSAVGICALGGGFAAGYFIGKKHGTVTKYYQVTNTVGEEAGAEIEVPGQGTIFDEPAGDEDNVVYIEDLNDDDLEELEEESESEDEDEEDIPVEDTVIELLDEEDTPIIQTVFNDDDWNWEEEIEKRENAEGPYILHQDEYFRDEEGFSQSTLVYYVGDNILVDEQEHPIYNHSSVVGEMQFGHGTTGDNVVYIRNVERRAEYEILRNDGHYSIEVLGLQHEEELAHEIKHSEKIRRFRPED